MDTLLKIKEQNGSCHSIFCNECALVDHCPMTLTIEETRKKRLELVEELLKRRN